MSRLDPRNFWRQLSYAIKNQLGHPKEEITGSDVEETEYETEECDYSPAELSVGTPVKSNISNVSLQEEEKFKVSPQCQSSQLPSPVVTCYRSLV